MINYLFRKIVYSLLVIWGVATVVFFLFNILPGDPARMMVGQRADEETLNAIRNELGLNETLIIQYLGYLNNLSPVSCYNTQAQTGLFAFSAEKAPGYRKLFRISSKYIIVLKYPYLGKSFQTRKFVGDMLWEALPNSFILAITAIFIGSFFGLIAGILAAILKNSIYDRIALLFSAMGMALPSFFAAILIGWLFAYILGDITGLNLTGNLYEVDDYGNGMHLRLRNLVLPAVTLGIRPLAIVVQLTRNSLLEVLSQDYIRTAYAKGLSSFRIIYKHAMRNALNPVITAISGWFASLMAGVIFIEYIFGWKGLGYLIVNALNNYDFPLVLGSVIIISVIFVIINMLVDISYALLDPRVRKKT